MTLNKTIVISLVFTPREVNQSETIFVLNQQKWHELIRLSLQRLV